MIQKIDKKGWMKLVFSSAIFLFLFLPVVFLLHRLIPSRLWKNALLALSSIVFYAFGQLTYVPLFLASIVINYASGFLLMKAERRRRVILALSVILNIGKMPTCSAEDKDEPKLRYIDYEGRLDVEVYGNPKPCVGYFWKPLKNSNLRKGLIVYADDTTYREHALKCYKEKRFII